MLGGQEQPLWSQFYGEVIDLATYNVPQHWRRYRERYNLLGTKCLVCERTYFPLRKICPQCRRDGNPVDIRFSGKGTLFTYTIIRTASEDFKAFTPYVMGIVQLNEGPKVTSQIVDCNLEHIFIGMTVEVCFRKFTTQGKEGIISYGFKFRPREDSNNF